MPKRRKWMEYYITIGEIIRYYRKEQGLSQDLLSEGICSRKYLSHIERNKQIPSLDIINQLSKRLGVSLYDSYALMLRHHNIDTHKKIEYLTPFLSGETSEELIDIINEYKDLPGFQEGEPLQYIKYASSLYYANCLEETEKAIDIALEALSVNETFAIDDINSKRSFTNIELSLLNTVAVDYCRLGKKDIAKKYFQLIQKYLLKAFQQSYYTTNRNNQFEVKFLVNHVCNYFMFFRDIENIEIEIIDSVLSIQKKLHNNYLLPELLLCKIYLLMESEKTDEAKELYVLAHALGNYLYDSLYQKKHNEEYLLGKYYSYLSTC